MLRGCINLPNLHRYGLVCFIYNLQEQETLSFIRESLEKSDQLTKGMVRDDQFIYLVKLYVCVILILRYKMINTEFTDFSSAVQ